MTQDRGAARESAQEVWLAILEGLPGFRSVTPADMPFV
jgi:hypothetical protein